MPPTPPGPVAAALLTAVVAATACARDIHVRLPATDPDTTGTITIVLTQPATDLTVAIDGVLVAERAHTKKVRVDGVPAGLVDVDIAAGGGAERVERRQEVLVDAGGQVSIPVGAPTASMGSTVKMGALTLVAYVLSRAIIWAL